MSEDTRHVIVEDEALAAGFTQIPNLVLRRSDLQPGAKLTYMVLLSYAWQEDHAYPGQDRLAADMGVSERSVITYLKQLQETGLITIRRRGLGMTNVYVLHRLTPRSEKSASPEVQEPTALEVQDFRPKKTQRKNTQRDKFEHSKGPRLVEKYDEDREIIANYISDFAREFADQAPVASSISRAQNLYRQSGLSLDAFVDVLYAARQITKERSGAINGQAETLRGKPRMPYFFAVVEREIEHAPPATG